jgi:PAS domain S-box-containing protein
MPNQLFDPASYMINPIAVQTLLVALGVFSVGIFALYRMRISPVSTAFFLGSLAIGEWLFAYSWMYSTTDEQVALWWAKTGYIGISFIPAAVSQYISAVLDQDYEKVGKRVLAIWILSALFLALILSTDMQFSSLLHFSWGFYPKYGITSTPFLLFFFGVLIDSLYRFLKGYRKIRKGSAQSMAARELLIGIVVGYTASVDFSVGFGLKLYPFGYIPILLFIVISAHSILRYRLKTITPAFAARQIIDTMNDALIVLDSEGVVRLVNQMSCSMFGRSEQELVGNLPTKCMDNNRAFAGILESLVQGETVRNLELEYYRPEENTPGTLSLSASIMQDQAGVPLSVVCVVRDITGRKRAGEDLKQSVSLLKATLEATADGITVVDSAGKLVDFNRRFTEMLRLPDDIIASRDERRALQFLHDQLKNPKAFIDKVEELYANPDAESFDVLEFNDGRVFERYSKAQKIEDNSVGRVWSFRDITRQKKLEEELLKSQKLESLGVLAGGIAHDFNNILTAILGSVSLARMHSKPGDKIYSWLIEAEKASFRAKDLTQQLLTFSKGGSPVKKVISLVNSIKDSTSFALRGANVKCDLKVANGLWPLEADEGQMVQVFNNLIINACQAMPDGGQIKIAASNVIVDSNDNLPLTVGKYVKISLTDEGSGIPTEHLLRIFDPYFTTKQKGSGLGLAVTYSIIKNHGGHIEVESKTGSGTAFTIYLPASDNPIENSEMAGELRIAGKGKVLLMDDEEMVRTIGSEMLSELGYTVETVSDGKEAIDAYTKSKEAGKTFDAVVLDLTIPGGIGGKETIKILREIDPSVMAIVSSGYSNDPVMANFLEYGFNAVVSKPYRITELSRALQGNL